LPFSDEMGGTKQMKYFKIKARIEHADTERSYKDSRYWQNTLLVKNIDNCQKKRLIKIFKPLVEKEGDLLFDLVEKAL